MKNKEGFVTSPLERGSYSMYFLGQNILWALFGVIATFLNEANAAFTTEVVAAILLVPKLWDAVNDTLFGLLVDRFRFKNGQKYLPWVRIGVAAVGIITVFLFFMPYNLGKGAGIAWFVIGYLLFDAAYTMLDAPMFALTTVMTNNIQERTSIIAGGKLWSMVGAMLTTVLVPTLAKNLGWGWTSVVIVVISTILMIPILIVGKERHREENVAQENVSFKQMGKYLASNKYLLVVLVAMLIIGMTTVEQILAIIVSKTCFASSNGAVGKIAFATILSACVAVPVILVSALIPKMAKKWDKFNVLIGGMGFSVVMGLVSFFVGYGNPIVATVLVALKSLGLAFYTVICYMLVADTVEYGTYKSGARAAGITFSLQTFVSKLKNAFVNSFAFLCLAMVGYHNEESFKNNPGVADGVWGVFTLLPVIGYGIAIVLLLVAYKLRDKDVQAMADYNNGVIAREEVIAVVGDKFGAPAEVVGQPHDVQPDESVAEEVAATDSEAE